MNSSELGDLERLLAQVLPDPAGFGRRVVEQLMGRLSTDPPNGPPITEPGPHEAMQDRVVLLAAALGACDCWGHDAGCPSCSGRGSPGWVAPDPQLYQEFVAPAAAAMTVAAASTQRPEAPAEGNFRDLDLAGQR